ncbi:uncharacterized protein DUF4850 [Bibersteinia trehalosi]|uniref:DUF4850 domain-containing protein n=1 Tax=Bibersteinia trehalosi TaxID=47735 RepID=UPI0010CF6C6D|nr:DUF4850 domain-containing protein [Bibersteinia trehalosi]TCT16644.1 uncharacterized protein DUF4850 [Bibersteinia trehalosi]
MRKLGRLFGLLGSLLIISSTLSAEVYHFKFNHQDRSQDLTEYKPIVQDGGTVAVNGVKMKGFNTIFKDPRNAGPKTNYAKQINAKIKAEYLKHFELYAMPNGVVFVPKDWKLVYGGISSTGGIFYTFVPPHGDDGYLTFYHNGSCLSCAMENGSLFFSEAAKHAKDHDFNTFESNLPLNVVKIKQDLVSYYAESGYLRLDGIAFYDPFAKIPFWKAEVSLPPMQRHLVNPLLNQFITKYN